MGIGERRQINQPREALYANILSNAQVKALPKRHRNLCLSVAVAAEGRVMPCNETDSPILCGLT